MHGITITMPEEYMRKVDPNFEKNTYEKVYLTNHISEPPAELDNLVQVVENINLEYKEDLYDLLMSEKHPAAHDLVTLTRDGTPIDPDQAGDDSFMPFMVYSDDLGSVTSAVDSNGQDPLE